MIRRSLLPAVVPAALVLVAAGLWRSHHPTAADSRESPAESEAAPSAPVTAESAPAPAARAQAPVAPAGDADVEELLSSSEGQAIAKVNDVSGLLDSSPDRRKLLGSAARIAQAASSCIRAGGCRDPRNPERAYYDPTHGHVFTALSNALQLLQAAQAEGMALPPLPPETLVGNLSIPQPDVQLTSLELAMASGTLDGAGWAAVLDHAPDVEGLAKPLYFALLQQGAPPEMHEAVVDTLSRSLAGDEAGTVLEVLRSFDRLTLSEGEFRRAEHSLCPMIRGGNSVADSRAAVLYLSRYAAARGYTADPASDCGA